MSETPRLPPAVNRGAADVDDPSIPLLTDRIYLPALELDIAVPPPPLARPAAPVEPVAPVQESVSPPRTEPTPVDIIGSVEVPRRAAFGSTDLVDDFDLQPADEAEANRRMLRPTDEDGDIETGLDRDLIAELDADFEALLAAEKDLDKPVEEGPASAPAPLADAATERPTAPEAPNQHATSLPAADEPIATAHEAADDASQETSAETGLEIAAAAMHDAARSETNEWLDTSDEPRAGIEPPAESGPEAALKVDSQAASPSAAAADDGRDAGAMNSLPIAQPTPTPSPQATADADNLRTAVLEAVAQRLPEHIDSTVRDLLQPAIDQAVTKLGEEAQVALRISLQQLVEQVLREEIARRQTDHG